MTRPTRKDREYYDTLRVGMECLQQVYLDDRDHHRALAYWTKLLAQMAPRQTVAKPSAGRGSDV